MNRSLPSLLAALCLAGGPAASADTTPESAAPAPLPTLAATVAADSQGVFLDQLVSLDTAATVPHVRLTNAPPPGKSLSLNRAFVLQAFNRHAPELAATNLAGATSTRVTRRMRDLDETELRTLLAAALQSVVGDSGQVEVRLNRPWNTLPSPDDPLSLRVLDLPATGLGPNMIVRFDLLAGNDRFETFQLAVQCRLLRPVPVARNTLQRGQRLRDAEVVLEPRDVFAVRDPLNPDALIDDNLELTEVIRAGQPLLARSVRPRPLIRRGGLVEAVVQDGPLAISLKVEALDDGYSGQTLRVRNPKTRREYLAKVHDEQTVLLVL